MVMRGRRRWAALGAVVLVLGGGGGVAYALTRGSSSSSDDPTTTLVTVSSGPVQQSVTTTGTIKPAKDEDLSFTVSGTVTGVTATVGKRVAKGTVLATVDDTRLRSAVSTAQAAVTAARQELRAVAGQSATQVASARAQLASAQTDLANAKADFAAASLRAPFAGTVATVTIATGDVVGSEPSGAADSTTPSIRLISTDKWVVNASVGSADLAQLRRAQQAQITPSGTPRMIFGTISSVGIVATSSSSGSATFPVTIAVTGQPAGLYAGGSADVVLIVKQLAATLTVPTIAVHTLNGKTVVYRRVNSKRVTTEVTLGDSYGPSTVVTKGLASGDQVEITFARPTGGNGPSNKDRAPKGGLPPGGGPFSNDGGGTVVGK